MPIHGPSSLVARACASPGQVPRCLARTVGGSGPQWTASGVGGHVGEDPSKAVVHAVTIGLWPAPAAARGQTRVMDAPETVVDAIRLLRSDGHDVEFRLDGGMLRSDGDRSGCSCADVVVERLYRFEGPSDPGDEMVVFGLRDPATGQQGYLASAYGPDADPNLMEHLATLTARHPGR